MAESIALYSREYDTHKKKLTEKEEKLYNLIFKIKKVPDDYSVSQMELIKSVVSDPSNKFIDMIKDGIITLFGSHIFKGNVFAGDMDIIQYVPIEYQAQCLYDIVYKNIHGINKDYWQSFYFLGDIKCGMITKFRPLKQAIGDIEKGQIVNYDSSILSNLIDKSEFKGIKIPKKPSIEQWIKLYDIVHQLITRRWTADEVLKGYQLDGDKNKYLLKDAVYESELTKIDLFGGSIKIMEITNVLLDKKDIIPEEEFKKQIVINMLKHYYVDNNLMKSIKRVYALERHVGTNKGLVLNLHYYTQRSLTARLYFIAGELKVLIYILKNYFRENKIKDSGLIQDHILNIQQMVQNIYTLEDKVLNEFISDIDRYIFHDVFDNNIEASDNIINKCKMIIKHIYKVVNVQSKKFIEANKIDFLSYVDRFT